MSEFDQWITECPKCHNRDCLTVFQVTLVATGETIYPETPLHSDGFVVDPENKYDHLKDQSTEDETVRCDTCGEVFELFELFVAKPVFEKGPELDPAIEANNQGVDPFVCDYCGKWTEEDEVHEPNCPKNPKSTPAKDAASGISWPGDAEVSDRNVPMAVYPTKDSAAPKEKEDKPFVIHVLWGGDRTDDMGRPCKYRFKTEPELDAFILGVEEAMGFCEAVFTDEKGNEL